jgi:hypothetical protein
MKGILLFLLLANVAIHPTGGTIVTDGFVSQFVPRSPDNPDPADCRRLFNVYLPPTFFSDPSATFPIVYHMTGFGGNYATYSESDKAAMDMMLAADQINPLIIVAPDPRVLSYDGSFWVNSELNGQFESYIVEELIPYVNAKYRQRTTASGNSQPFRAMMGQSMGGYGSLYYGIKHPELFVAFAGDSSTSFWLITTNIASPPNGPPNGNVMYTFTKLLLPELPPNHMINPANGDMTFGFYAWAGAFSPIAPGPAQCSTEEPACKSAFPFCVAYPFQVNGDGTVVITGTPPNQSFVANPSVIDQWQLFDPYFLLDTANQEILKRQAIYLDAGANPVTEIIDNVGAHYFSQKLTGLDINNEYILFNGGHVDCTTIDEISCYRFTTNLKIFSGKFSEAGIFAPDVRTKITGVMTIELTDNAVFSINNKRLVGIETLDLDTPQNTAITFRILDSARLEIGNEVTLGGALQVGNAFGKANLLFKPVRNLDTISCTFEIDGPHATLEIGRQGFLGFGIGVDGIQTLVPNYWGCSSLTNVTNVTFNFIRGRFMHSQIASSIDPRAALLGLGDIGGYIFNLAPRFVIAGGANLAKMQVCNLIHPTVLDTAGVIDPGGIRNKIVVDPQPPFDDFYGPNAGIITSDTFYFNKLDVSILSSSTMLRDRNKTPLVSPATVDDFFAFLMVDDYLAQASKQATIADFSQLRVGYLTQTAPNTETIERVPIEENQQCSPTAPDFPLARILKEGAVGIKLATINGVQTILRLYDLNPRIEPLPSTEPLTAETKATTCSSS